MDMTIIVGVVVLAAAAAGAMAWRHYAPRSIWYGVSFPLKAVRVYLTWGHVAAGCKLTRTRRRMRWGEPECCQSHLSVRMIQSIHAVLRNALQTAVREEIIPRNVAQLVKVTTPKYKVNRGLTVAEARTVLKAAEDERLHALYVLALCLGLRRGELLGLRWEHVDLDAGTLEVVQALQRVGGELRFVRPKTEDSERTIPLPDLCISALREHRKLQFAERSNAWPDWRESGLVFTSRIGTPIEPDNLRRSWGRIRKRAGLRDVRFHDTRHTCVSLLLALKVPPHVVRDIVGHSDIEVTMTIYAHAALDDKRAAFKTLGDALG